MLYVLTNLEEMTPYMEQFLHEFWCRSRDPTPQEYDNILGMTSMDTVFAQQTTTKVSPIGKRVLESLRLALTMSIILDESKKYMNSIFMVPNLLLQ
jgi:hypothetical protein